jgi:hypothetical protein
VIAVKLTNEERSKRIEHAIVQFEKHDLLYSLKNEATGQFHVYRKCDDMRFVFYANGTIANRDERGIHTLIKLLLEEAC